MALIPTLRRSGHHMVTVAVKHHVARSTVVDTIASELWDDYGAEDLPVSKLLVERTIRDAYRSHGGEWDMSAGDRLDDMDDGQAAEDWANRQVRRLWPGWVD